MLRYAKNGEKPAPNQNAAPNLKDLPNGQEKAQTGSQPAVSRAVDSLHTSALGTIQAELAAVRRELEEVRALAVKLLMSTVTSGHVHQGQVDKVDMSPVDNPVDKRTAERDKKRRYRQRRKGKPE
jgi:hypothetical protein